MKAALVTGGARGIGLATAKELLAEGWQVAILDRDSEALEAAGTEVAGLTLINADVSRPEDVERAVAEITAAFGRLDGLVNNAGVADFGPIRETTFERWRRVMETNLDGPFLMTQAFTDLLAADGGGAVVNITSISGLRASTLRVAYGTSKAALAQLTLQQAAELGEIGIRVNAVAPGPVATKLAMAVHSPEIIAAYHDALPLNRYGKEEEIAAAINFLLSEKASFITGQVLAADGGFEATGIGLPALRADAAKD
ncbi:MAG: SDR family NAD(P)-dependent oxidoreductase [Pseudophaeobacter sp. bin_em_oilr2.035]|uniref:SDR family NAD(P)-dependent oxidoreductase n=1 Tax=Phaeobacter gallaeciensis TaxID=60890 RepID=A0ABD4XA63_9RHOB|nr:SDR family oxidoreductase [Phaeobacter gallaeciensis]MDF1771648.1 SDR family NAD(P)-dependent oxidoreductase [Pseudophaeobacter sp. bin_em_oilr2.035]MDE4145284.1 SDR family NAD(P)-dependent oxidoreductase [Phaeobacter gallaeciensis]MDE4157955.1 SDR family NAD(P)-dependent oxidoreductase [Phaeobacter gallaeciensis]MDE4162134.1 SDR family NAD(P)-dependent oxidoreductase [Phaeobacter gallaeciensis]MDE4166360.1 SDR family NAD(P)-dependent oxidoreductase [Phaeobacter gallaeciensis]